MKISAVIVALNEAEYIQPCIKAIYPFVDRIKIQTGYDRGWTGKVVTPDATVQKILEIPDRDGKISLHISRIPDEAIARNWLMRSDGYNLNHRHLSTTSSLDSIQNFCELSDYFWIIDGDEIYDPETIPDILNYVNINKPQVLKIRGINYFKSWNYQISPSDQFFQPGFVKRGMLFRENRNLLYPQIWSNLMRIVNNKYWRNKELTRFLNLFGLDSILPEEIGVFHHGSYVGSDARIRKKISNSGHYDKRMDEWYENIWEKWTPEMQNIHPIYPNRFLGVKHISTDCLPSSIKNEEWDFGYIESPSVQVNQT